MFRVGISGGMGSGKTLVCQIFEQMKIPIYNADIQAKRLMIEDENLKLEIIRLLGSNSYKMDNSLNRSYISQKVFKDSSLLNKLNNLVHPAVIEDGKKWERNLPLGTPYFLRESAILFETGIYKNLDFNILVVAPEYIRINRIKKRDGLTESEIKERLNQQWSDDKKIKLCNFVIENDGTKNLIPQIWKIHNQLIHHSSKQLDKQQDIKS